ncbi:NUDIX domain-containing protein [Pseudomaricurvus alkylphenolicus]|uniref:NUDIX domain-containing protein n=1 Tax=Pseudomaricurvus alkylphenolicus TaxID=1306991 RepID=UPI001421C902|nr:NUDIX domain-containing protein [Pseudomaricurvus alkylphenolicus]NIB42878.1 NUDIX domain-containing protein [Pseudomaricurvus alkylphenolicus]
MHDTQDFLRPAFGRDDLEMLEREQLHQGFFRMERLHYRHRCYQGGWSGRVSREVLYRGEAVGAVLYDPQRDLIGLVEQARPGALDDPNGPWCLEVVAGMIEAGEERDDVMRREMQEETGLQPQSLEYICQYLASPGGCDERLHVYCALVDLEGKDGIVSGLDHEGEDIRLLVMPASAVFEHLYGGRFNNAATLIALQWLQMNRPRLCQATTAPA